ncbi:helix-turn-helix transcriptional regulator [Providencia sneebia]|uniref:AraC family transcriptional regulator n=1 Tax=Providencia sneebia DSM 19967 TaxID=1141660 RepID=K8WRT1_9GAMM|nr:AraC family transcriptional regulator [Providencia sneebia]EKT60152.1 AraC family transcriptional regulator [Providencia sneebia DSM 19967]
MHNIFYKKLDLLFAYQNNQQPTKLKNRKSLIESIDTEYLCNGILLNKLSLTLAKDITEYCEGPPTMSISIVLKGKGKMYVEGGRIMDIEPGMAIVFYSPNGIKGCNTFYQGEIDILDIRYSLTEMQSKNLPAFSSLQRHYEQNASYLDTIMIASPISPNLVHIIRQIENCSLDGEIRKTYLYAKSLEILALIMSKTQQEYDHTAVSSMQRRAIYCAIKLLHNSYEQAWTIRSLSKAVGINERKLKEGFKIIISSTFHQYLEQVRMTAAQEYLKQGMNVVDVAIAVGYASPSHFSKRFRQHHNINPKLWQLQCTE